MSLRADAVLLPRTVVLFWVDRRSGDGTRANLRLPWRSEHGAR